MMSSYFWRPISPELAEMWSRCSNCRLSGPTQDMYLWFHKTMQLDMYICRACMADELLKTAMARQGWLPWDK